MHVDQLDTPAVLINRSVLQRNIARMQQLADTHGVQLRPHIKTHKSAVIAKLQIEAGATGITVATLSEAEIMAQHGISDIFVAYPIVGAVKAERLRGLLRTFPKVKWRFTIDSLTGAYWLSHAVPKNHQLDVVIEVDTGMERCGVSGLEQARLLANACDRFEALRLVGVMTHAGHAHDVKPLEIENIAHAETIQLSHIADSLRGEGYAIQVVSAGSTLTSVGAVEKSGLTEIRPGTYVFNDLRTEELNVCDRGDIAGTILTTVVSRPTATRLIVDAGSKTLTPTSVPLFDFGRATQFSDLRVVRLSEEHGVCSVSPENPLRVGDRIELLPIHICVVINMQCEVYLVEGESVTPVAIDAHLASR